MKRLFILLIVACVIATISCTKEVSTKEMSTNVLTNAAQSMQAMSQDNATAGGPAWGIWPHDNTTNECMNEANAVGVKYLRTTIHVKRFNGKESKLDQYISKGYKVLVNLNWDGGGDVPFPKDMNAYKNALSNVLDKYASKIEVAVIENEPTTDKFYNGPIEDYITELKNAVDVCKQHGVKVADGGIHVANVLLVKAGKPMPTRMPRK